VRTTRRKGDRHPIHLVWVATNQTAVCGDVYPRLRIAVEYRDNHPVLTKDPLFCAECVKRITRGDKAPPRQKQERRMMR